MIAFLIILYVAAFALTFLITLSQSNRIGKLERRLSDFEVLNMPTNSEPDNFGLPDVEFESTDPELDEIDLDEVTHSQTPR